MNLTFSSLSLTKCRKSALFSIARLCGLCLLCFGSVASADVTLSDLQPLFSDVDNISTDTRSIYQNTRYIQGYLQTLNQTQSTQSDYQRKILLSLTGQVDGYPPVGYIPISTLLQEIASNTKNSGDILAGNPWWATNSNFSPFLGNGPAINGVNPNTAQPTDPSSIRATFPEIFSWWSAQLNAKVVSQNGYTKQQWENFFHSRSWRDLFGTGRMLPNGNLGVENFTWFDWMAEVEKMKLDKLDLLSNLLSSNSVSGGSFDDVLAGNPWWVTNSAFARNWQAYEYVWPKSEQGLSFPEAFSAFLASRTTTAVTESDLWDSWGLGGINQRRMYTWEDFIAEAVRSNMVLSTSATYSNLVEELEDNGYDTSPSMPTNSLPGYELPQERDFSAARSQLAQGEQATQDLIANIPKPSTGGNSEIVLIPEFTVGGIHVREYRASLNSSIVPVCRGVLTFLYGVGVACYLFRLAKTEYIFYASLGRAWGTRE